MQQVVATATAPAAVGAGAIQPIEIVSIDRLELQLSRRKINVKDFSI